MHEFIERQNTNTIVKRLNTTPCVALLGARQSGKSTLAGVILEQFGKLNQRLPKVSQKRNWSWHLQSLEKVPYTCIFRKYRVFQPNAYCHKNSY